MNSFQNDGIARKVIIIGDFNNNDSDDELSLLVARALQEMGLIEILCVIANTDPALKRARLARGLMDLIGLAHVPVGIGEIVLDRTGPFPDEEMISYMAPAESLFDGQELLIRSLREVEGVEVVLVLQSAMSDAAKLLREHRDLFIDSVSKVVIMGGVELDAGVPKLTSGYMTPNTAMNNLFNLEDAKWLYRRIQELGIPMVITTREAAIAAQASFSVFDAIEAKNPEIGACLKRRHALMTQRFWESCCAPAGSVTRGLLHPDRNRAWYVKVFCGGVDPEIEDGGQIVPFITARKFNLYDPANLIMALDELRNLFANPHTVEIGIATHEVIGLTSENNGIRNKELFATMMEWLIVEGVD